MIRKLTCMAVMAGMILAAAPAAAQFVSPFFLYPVVAKGAGVNSDWMTNLVISNLSPFPVEVTARFFEEGQANSFMSGPSHTVILQAGQTLNVEDVLGSWFPQVGDTKGSLMLLGEPMGGQDPEGVRLAATGRIFNNYTPNATYGQTVNASLVNFMFGAGSSVLPGAEWSSRVRSNVGVVNLGPQSLTVLITTFNANGAQVAQETRTIPAMSMGQWSLEALGVSNLNAPGRVEVEIDPATITWDPCNPGTFGLVPMFEAYISRVTQATGDAEFVMGLNDWTEFVDDCGYDPDDGDDDCPP